VDGFYAKFHLRDGTKAEVQDDGRTVVLILKSESRESLRQALADASASLMEDDE
jgi:hypothetical protein